jgi:endonuclease/exonuclease/phosphatase family metal-dependent hydrolase
LNQYNTVDGNVRPSGRYVFLDGFFSAIVGLLKAAFGALIRWISTPLRPIEDMPLRWQGAGSRHDALATMRRSTLTVINMNLWHDWPRHRRLPERLEQFSQLVEQEGAQLVLLQEALRTSDVEAHSWLADRLGMQAFYQRANGNRAGIGFEEGVAVLTSLPVLDIRIQTLSPSSEPFVRRVALGVEIKTERASFWAFSTHLGLIKAHNAMQIEHLREWVTEMSAGKPALIGGDFNAHESTSQIARISREWIDTFRWLHPGEKVNSHTLRWPWGSALRKHRLDYLFLKPAKSRWRILEADYLDHGDDPLSDHKAVLTRLAPASLN